MVTEEETDEAFGAVDPVLLEVMKEAAANIEEFHNHQKRENWFIEKEGNIWDSYTCLLNGQAYMCRVEKPLIRPASLMNIIPAKCAEVTNIFVATPRRREGQSRDDRRRENCRST